MGVCIVQEQASHLRLLGTRQGIICSFPICLFCLALIFQICLNYFLPKIIHIPPRSVCHASTTGMSPAPRHMCKYHDSCVDTVD